MSTDTSLQSPPTADALPPTPLPGTADLGTAVDDFAERLVSMTLGGFQAMSVHVGHTLGWYRALVASPATSAELARRTGSQERYVREWLEMQAGMGILSTDATQPAGVREYVLPPAAAEVLTDELSLAYTAPFPSMITTVAAQMPHLLDAYAHGGGVGWAEFGDSARTIQAALNRPWFERALGPALAGVPEVHDVLDRPGARILDIGCGGGWSTIALSRAYPGAVVEGVDIDGPSVELARRNAESAGMAGRVSFRVADAASVSGRYDAAFAFECLHDMPRPVEVLTSLRRSVGADGVVVVMDEAVAEEFQAPAGFVDQVMYGFSMFLCLPDGLSSPPSAGTGTVFRRSTLEGYARAAGFGGVDVLPIEDFSFFRFYRLRH